MLLVGSRALVHHFPTLDRKPVDWDFICTFEEFQKWTKENKSIIRHCVPLSGDKYHVRDVDGMNYEFELAWEDTTGKYLLDCFDISDDGDYTIADPATLLFLKLSHRYLKNSPHFLKTMRDIQFLRSQGVELYSEHEDLMAQREAETYVYKHPKLDVTSKEFFNGDGVDYVYNHDTIHLTVALTERDSYRRTSGPSTPGVLTSYGELVKTTYPAYTFYMKDGSEVMTSKEKFFSVPEQIRLYGVYEEACVLALERSQIVNNMMVDVESGKVWFDPSRSGPTPRWSFEMALMKVCTSITSGWFREYAWENYDRVLDLYNSLGENDYVDRFIKNQHLLKPYTGEKY